MSKQEILCTPYGEMLDMLACHSIYEGGVKPKKKKHHMSMEDFLGLE